MNDKNECGCGRSPTGFCGRPAFQKLIIKPTIYEERQKIKNNS